MAAKISSPIRITQKLKLIWLAIADPDAFEQAEKLENVSLSSRKNAEVRRVYIVRQAYISSLILMSSAVFAGWILAALVRFICPQSKILATALAVSGTSLLLWTTVAVRSWDVASFSNVTLGERLNVWLFRSLYWIGTTCLVAALFLS